MFSCLVLTSTKMKIRTISASFPQPFCSRNPTLYLTASLRCHRQSDVNIDHCGKAERNAWSDWQKLRLHAKQDSYTKNHSRFAYSHFAYSRFAYDLSRFAYSHFAYSRFAYSKKIHFSRFAYSSFLIKKWDIEYLFLFEILLITKKYILHNTRHNLN